MSQYKENAHWADLPFEVLVKILALPQATQSGHPVCKNWLKVAVPEVKELRLTELDLLSLSRVVGRFTGLRHLTLLRPPPIACYKSALECIARLSMLESVTFVGWSLPSVASNYPPSWKEGSGPSRFEFRDCDGNECDWRALVEASSMKRCFGFAPFEHVPTVLCRDALYLSDLVSPKLFQEIMQTYYEHHGTDSDDETNYYYYSNLALCLEGESLVIPYNQELLDHMSEVLKGLRIAARRLWILDTCDFDIINKYPYLCGIRELYLCIGCDLFDGDIECAVDLLPSLEKLTLEDNGGWIDEEFEMQATPNPLVSSVCLRATLVEENTIMQLMKKFPSALFRLTVLEASNDAEHTARAEKHQKALQNMAAATPRVHPVVERGVYNSLYA